MKILGKLERIFFAFAAVWSCGASLYLLLLPVAIHEISAQSSANGASAVEETVSYVSWYQVQGAWGVVVLVIFALLYIAAAIFAVRGQRILLAAASLIALVITYLAGFSIGALYLPAAIAVLVGWTAIGLNRLLRIDRGNPV